MAIHNVNGPCDVHVRAGDLTLLNLQIAQRRLAQDSAYSDIRLVISLEATKGQVRNDYYLTSGRSHVTQIVIADWLTVPDVSPGLKKQQDNEKAISDKLELCKSFFASIGGSYFVQLPFFSPNQFAVRKGETAPSVFRHGRGHDLMVTVSSHLPMLRDNLGKEWLFPTTFDSFCKDARIAIRYFCGWHLCAEPVYNSLGMWFSPKHADVAVVDGEWTFVEPTPHVFAPQIGQDICEDDVADDGNRSDSSANSSKATVNTPLSSVQDPPTLHLPRTNLPAFKPDYDDEEIADAEAETDTS